MTTYAETCCYGNKDAQSSWDTLFFKLKLEKLDISSVDWKG